MRLPGLSALRGLAAVAIVLHHGCGHLASGTLAGIWQDAGWSGVPAALLRSLLWLPDKYNHEAVLLFVLLSGYCIHLSLAFAWAQGTDRRLALLPYYRRRAVRLFPMLLAAIALTGVLDCVSAWVAGPLPAGSLPSTPQVAAVLGHDYSSLSQVLGTAFVAMPFWIKPYGSNWPLWVLGWLAWFYLLYPVYVAVSRRFGGPAAVGLSVVVMGVSILARKLVGEFPLYPVFRTWWLWCVGAYCAEVFAGRHSLPLWRRIPAWSLVPIFLATAWAARLVLRMPAIVSYGVWTPVLCLLVLKLCMPSGWVARLCDNPWLQRLGDMSFSLYVSHMPAMVLLSVLWVRGQGGLPRGPWLVLGGAALLLVLGLAFYLVVERPLERIGRSARSRAADQGADPTAMGTGKVA